MSKKMKLGKEDKVSYNDLPDEVRAHIGRFLPPCAR